MIYDENTFDVATAKVGDLVTEQVVDNFMNVLPPRCMRSDCAQLGEPYNHVPDENGVWKATYVTFKRFDNSTWVYCGKCFAGRNTEPCIQNMDSS